MTTTHFHAKERLTLALDQSIEHSVLMPFVHHNTDRQFRRPHRRQRLAERFGNWEIVGHDARGDLQCSSSRVYVHYEIHQRLVFLEDEVPDSLGDLAARPSGKCPSES